MTKLTSQQRIYLAAILGGTNSGLAPPSLTEVERMVARPLNLESAAHFLWAHYAETDDMMDCFLGEIKHWHKKTLAKMSAEQVLSTWGKYHPELKAVLS